MHQNVGAKDFGWWESSSSVNGSVIGTIDVSGPAAGILESADRILAFNGDPRAEKVGAAISGFLFFLGPYIPFASKGADKSMTSSYAYVHGTEMLWKLQPTFP